MADLNETRDRLELKEMIEFNAEKRIRKKVFHSQMINSEIACYEPGQGTVLHVHPKQDEIFYVIEGKGALTFEDSEFPLQERSTVFVPAGTKHGVRTYDDSRLVLMFTKGPGVPQRGRA
jgi:mannose-6-phosphate isomerase-like protein (cupin superfamily)